MECKKKVEEVDVAVIVTSAPDHFILREAIRKSWGADIPKTWHFVFYVGVTLNKDIQVRVLV